MTFINLILDLAGLLLWLSWRSVPYDPLRRATPATLAGTVRRAEPSRMRRWHFLGVLVLLLVLRGLVYSQIGPAVNWTPRIDLGIVALVFRGNNLVTSLLFSALSFARTWMIFHFWLLALVILNGGSTESNPFHKLILLQLGWIGRWRPAAQALLPGLVTALAWLALHPILARVGVVKLASSTAHLLEQSALLGVGIYFTLKNLLPIFLFAHLVASYVFLGASPLWDYVGATSRTLLLPLRRVPLRFGRIDFAPLVGIILILLFLHVLPNVILDQLSARNVTVWPQ